MNKKRENEAHKRTHKQRRKHKNDITCGQYSKTWRRATISTQSGPRELAERPLNYSAEWGKSNFITFRVPALTA
jgi:hypothetical protein